MSKQNSYISLVCGFVAMSMCIGLVATAFFAHDRMVDDAVAQIEQTRQQALDTYETVLLRHSNYDVAEPDDDVQSQMPSVMKPSETESVSDNTWDGEPSIGVKDGEDNDETIDATEADVIASDKDPVPENTGWDEDAAFVEHMVVYGDTLSTIADRYGVLMDDIVEFNDIENVDVIYVGRILVIPMTSD